MNDRFGHELGDQVLKRVAELLRTQVRAQDVVARWGGEEFILLFPETSGSGATVVAEKIRARIEAEVFESHGHNVNVALTIGLAEVSRDEPIDKSTARADRALYEGKHRGKNCIVLAPAQDSVVSDSPDASRPKAPV